MKTVMDKMSVIVLHDVASLKQHVLAWEDLVATAIEPNVFYEPWMLLPALERYGAGADVCIALIYGPHPTRRLGDPVLYGLIPLERKRVLKGSSVSSLCLWQHKYCFLCTPLIRLNFEEICLSTLFDWLAHNPLNAEFIEFGCIRGDGPFYQHLIAHLYHHPAHSVVKDSYLRALLIPGCDPETYLNNSLSGKHRKEVRRQGNRLSEIGALEYVSLQPDEPIIPWIDMFLQLEASGWKGKEASAFISTDLDEAYFRTITQEAHRRKQLMLLALNLNAKPIAMKCNFIAGNGSFAFKIAYDECYKAYSPGVQLEMENIRQFHRSPDITWMDSCAAPDHFMINRLWTARRTIKNIRIGCSGAMGNFLLAALPLFRWLRRGSIGGLMRSYKNKAGESGEVNS